MGALACWEGMRTIAQLKVLSNPSPQPREASRPDRALEEIRRFLHDELMKPKKGPEQFEQFERELHRRVMDLERVAVGECLEANDVNVEAVEVGGKVHRKVLRSPETYMTAAGPVQVMRTLYKDRSNEGSRAIAAVELNVGIIAGFWTPLAAKLAEWVVAQMTPGKAEELFQRVGNMTPSKSTLDRLPKDVSERWEGNREQFEAIVRQQSMIPEDARTVAVSLDGVLAPMDGTDKAAKKRATAAKGRPTKGPAGYREVGCGTLSFCDEQGQALSVVRLARGPEHKKKTLKASLIAELTEALAKRRDLRVVKLADGAADNWTFLSEELPEGPEVIDFFHAAEHLEHGLAAAYGEGTVETRSKFAQLRVELLEAPDGVEKVIRSLAYLQKKFPRRARIATELAYFRKHRTRMRYAQFTADGLPIGSGVVEAACKSVVTQRLKLSGMRWSDEGAQAVLTPRALDQSGRFDQAWALVAATYHAEVTTLHNVRPLPPPPARRRR